MAQQVYLAIEDVCAFVCFGIRSINVDIFCMTFWIYLNLSYRRFQYISKGPILIQPNQKEKSKHYAFPLLKTWEHMSNQCVKFIHMFKPSNYLNRRKSQLEMLISLYPTKTSSQYLSVFDIYFV